MPAQEISSPIPRWVEATIVAVLGRRVSAVPAGSGKTDHGTLEIARVVFLVSQVTHPEVESVVHQIGERQGVGPQRLQRDLHVNLRLLVPGVLHCEPVPLHAVLGLPRPRHSALELDRGRLPPLQQPLVGSNLNLTCTTQREAQACADRSRRGD